MVGVPGKSNGCKTCRARKIACDQQKPVCGQCTRSDRVCGGYLRDRVFVLVKPAAKEKHVFLRPPAWELRPDLELPQGKEYTLRNLSTTDDQSANTLIQATGGIEILPKLNMAGVGMQRRQNLHDLVQAFIANCFPDQWSSLNFQSWIRLLGLLPTKVLALELSSTAVAASAIGHKFQDAALVQESHKLYIQGLKQLQRALRDPKLVLEDGTLAACMALCLYEAMECPSGGSGGYFSHRDGLLSLVRARGIHAHSSGAGHQLFLGVRIMGILYALESHSPSFLSEFVWMEYPWKETIKTHFTQVVDCLAYAPAILQRVHMLPCLAAQERIDLRDSLVHECWRLNTRLDMILDEMQHATPGPLCWPVPSKTAILSECKDLGALFPLVFDFSDLESATSLVLIWAMRVMLWSTLYNLHGVMNLEGSIDDDSAPPRIILAPNATDPLQHFEKRLDYLAMANHVCQSVEYIIGDKTLLVGLLSITPALAIVRDSLRGEPNCDQKVAWLSAAIKLARKRGLGLLKYTQ